MFTFLTAPLLDYIGLYPHNIRNFKFKVKIVKDVDFSKVYRSNLKIIIIINIDKYINPRIL